MDEVNSEWSRWARPRRGGRIWRFRSLVLLLFAGAGFLLLARPPTAGAQEVEQRWRDLGRPLAASTDLDELLDAAAAAQVVLLGEATHGTREFYQWRSVITQRLIAEQGVRLIAIEGDWRPALELNAYLRGDERAKDAATALRRFKRWPQWMWANVQFAELIEWIRNWNRGRPLEDQVQLYGLDVYGHRASLAALETFVRLRLPDRGKEMRRHLRSLRRLGDDGQAYAAELGAGGTSLENHARAVADRLRGLDAAVAGISDEERRTAQQDAAVIERAEAYYRAMPQPGAGSWNVRAEHMWSTLQRLLSHRGPAARAVVWAHNTHVGDARATNMAPAGMVNLGRLAREALGEEEVFIVGFATYRGEVIAARDWGARRRVFHLPPAQAGSWDDALQRAWGGDRYLLFDEAARKDAELLRPRPQRAVGVVYEARNERTAHYTETILPRRYDALLFISQTHALQPLR